MKNIIPFKKDVIFKTKLSEITSISLENTLKMIDGVIEGNFIISGEYKNNEDLIEPFSLEIPFKNVMEERFLTDKAIIDIDDFYYEIAEDNVLSVCIDVLVDKLEEKPLIELDNIKEDKIIEKKNEDRKIESEEIKEKISTIFNSENNEDIYVTYNVFIVREGDNLDTILDKYNITKEELEKYNDLNDIKIGDKIIIPSEN